MIVTCSLFFILVLSGPSSFKHEIVKILKAGFNFLRKSRFYTFVFCGRIFRENDIYRME